MVVIKYPLLLQGDFSFSEAGDSSQQVAQLSGTQEELAKQDSELEHGAAMSEEDVSAPDVAIFSGEVAETVTVTAEESPSEEIQEISLGEEVDEMGDTLTQDALQTADQNSQSSSKELKKSDQEIPVAVSSGEDTQDALSAVEDLIGPINANDTLMQSIANYKQEAKALAETGKAQGNRSAIKWGFYVVNQVEKIEQELANGKEMTISEWNDKKAELDLSLAKANDA